MCTRTWFGILPGGDLDRYDREDDQRALALARSWLTAVEVLGLSIYANRQLPFATVAAIWYRLSLGTSTVKPESA